MTRNVQAVVFDLGETLLDETRHWSLAAQFTGVPYLTFAGVLGGLIERRENHRSLFGYLNVESVDPNVFGYQIELSDFYPDALPILRQLQANGYRIGITGNQPIGATSQVQALDLPVDFVASSAEWGVSKPAPEFFAKIAEACNLEPAQILYVGDRLDNDVLPAQALGFQTVFLRRGPWGHLHATWPEAKQVQRRIDSLTGIPKILEQLNAAS